MDETLKMQGYREMFMKDAKNGYENKTDVLKKRYGEQKITFLFCAVICFMGLVLCFRVHFGVDFTDESHYLALAKRFSQGDRPFREEWFPTQIIGILLLPFFNIYTRNCWWNRWNPVSISNGFCFFTSSFLYKK